MSDFQFVSREVLVSPEAIRLRRRDLLRAVIQGSFRQASTVRFQTLEGVQEVEDVVEMVTDKQVIFKSGNTIPVHCVRSIVIFK